MESICPFHGNGQWYKGNLHCHSTQSDGKLPPEEVVAFYKQRQYDFVALTEHHLFTYHQHLADPHFLIIPALEVSVEQEHIPKYEHLNGFQIAPPNSSPPPAGAFAHGEQIPATIWKQREDVQETVNTLRQKGMAVTLNHPSWSRSDRETLLHTHDYFAIEIYNHTSEYDEHLGLAVDYWDYLLRRGRKIWGLAVDDAHHYDDERANGGWVMVSAPELSQQAIMTALLDGAFYSTRGPEIYDFRIEDGEVCIACSPVQAIHFITYQRRGKSIRANDCGPLTSARWALHGDEFYVRVECEGVDGKSAWTNPLYYNPEFEQFLQAEYLT